MRWEIAIFAALLGYLVGSVSFARIILAIVSPGSDLSRTTVQRKDGKGELGSDLVSATTVSVRVGSRYGFITMALDMFKLIIPTLIIKLVYAPEPYHLITALAGMIGHIWPVFFHFKGGRGLTVVWGSMIVIDWLGMVVTAIVGMAVGAWVLRRIIMVYMMGLCLMVPWLWIRFRDWRYVLYALLVNIIFYVSAQAEIRELRKLGDLTEEEILIQGLEISAMGRGILKLSRRMGIFADTEMDYPKATGG